MFQIRFVAILLSLLLLTSCVSNWKRIDDKNNVYQNSWFTFNAPAGWMLFDRGDSVTLSRDGPDLQRIGVVFNEPDKAFPTIKKPASTNMLPSELAELTIAEIRASQKNGMPGMEIVSNMPVTIDGHQGFALHLRFKLDSGLRYETLVNGFVTLQGLYALYFRAPTLHFFNRDQVVYNKIIATFRVNHHVQEK